MKLRTSLLASATLVLQTLLCTAVLADDSSGPQRVVTLGGSVTEIVFALGMQGLLVGSDQSSLYPAAARDLPSVGYYRQVPAEGVLRLKPDLVIASEQAGPPQALGQLVAMGLRVEKVSDSPGMMSLHRRIREVAGLLGVPERGSWLSAEIDAGIRRASLIPIGEHRALLVVMRSGKLLGAGSNTAAASILKLAGLTNVLQAQDGYKPVTAEIVSALSPTVVVVTSSSVASLGGMGAVREHPALRMTPAALTGRVIELDDLLAQSMGPRLALAIQQIRTGAADAQP